MLLQMARFHLFMANIPFLYIYYNGASLIAQLVKNLPAMQETPV